VPAKTEIILSRLAHLAWAAALAAAAYSTWSARQVEYGSAYTALGCVGSFDIGGSALTRLASAPVGDAYEIAGRAVVWGVPSVLVLTGFLMSATTEQGDHRTPGGRPAPPSRGRGTGRPFVHG
jgi:hypothetical protein